jgi:hypothetical protein
MQEIFGVVGNTATGYLNDAANFSNATVGTPATYTGSNGFAGQASAGQPFPGFGTSAARDLSDLFVAGTVPSGLPGLSLTESGYAFNRKTNKYSQTVTVTNLLSQAITGPVYLVVENLSSNTSLTNATGTTVSNAPGSSYVSVSNSGLAAGASQTVTLQFSAPTSGAISETLATLVTTNAP